MIITVQTDPAYRKMGQLLGKIFKELNRSVYGLRNIQINDVQIYLSRDEDIFEYNIVFDNIIPASHEHFFVELAKCIYNNVEPLLFNQAVMYCPSEDEWLECHYQDLHELIGSTMNSYELAEIHNQYEKECFKHWEYCYWLYPKYKDQKKGQEWFKQQMYEELYIDKGVVDIMAGYL